MKAMKKFFIALICTLAALSCSSSGDKPSGNEKGGEMQSYLIDAFMNVSEIDFYALEGESAPRVHTIFRGALIQEEEAKRLRKELGDYGGHYSKGIRGPVVVPVKSFTGIDVTSDTQLDYIAYKYGDNAEVKKEATGDNKYKIEVYVDNIVETEQLLVVEAVDKNGNSSTKEQRVKGTKKPTITNTRAYVDPNNSQSAIIEFEVKDNTGLQMIVVYLNGEEAYKTSTDKPIAEQPELLSDGKTFSFGIRVNPGETTIKINAYNVYNQVETYDNIIKF